MLFRKLLNPPVFQGSLKKRNYFEGWYFKHVSDDMQSVFALIPGVSLNASHPHAFIQYINGLTGETHYFEFELNDFKTSETQFWVRIGGNEFSADGIAVDLNKGSFHLKARFTFEKTTPYPFRILSPGIMGWYSYVPKMECYHGVVSVNHFIQGEFTLNGNTKGVRNGKGYIEKDWGHSFPKAWIWTQCNNFNEPALSVMFSYALIPWMGRQFMGFLAFVWHKGKYYLFSTYNKAKVDAVKHTDGVLDISLLNKNCVLNIQLTKTTDGELIAPKQGKMDRMIKESVDAKMQVVLKTKGGKSLLDARGVHAGLEIVEDIFKYI